MATPAPEIPRPAAPTSGPKQADRPGRKATLCAAGGLLGALGACASCILPLGLFSFGMGGAWIGNLLALAPYQSTFVAVALGLLAVGFYLAYRKPKAVCADGNACARPHSNRTVKTSLWIASLLVFAAVAFSYVEPMLLGL